MSGPDGNSSWNTWLDVGQDGSVNLPEDCLAAARLQPGSRMMVRVVDGNVQLVSHVGVAMEIQRMIDKGLDPSSVWAALPGVDGLIVERRLEALREERERNPHHHAAE
ncbi:MAG: hypothetical protein HZA66_17220 [Rhodopseudomonas palustris]|uniref:Uncharacterized protein n=1 Tax=Rhodopseudomonas palustris TaxID=1076 RepID=A0A933RYS8_RHOPL|nr:hypothetical protein [Rhodopseudomonas palustris]